MQLCLGTYKTSGRNTVAIAKVLRENSVNYIPEAHCYLNIKRAIYDITFNILKQLLFTLSLMPEELIHQNQIGLYKIGRHQQFLKAWILQENKILNFET